MHLEIQNFVAILPLKKKKVLKSPKRKSVEPLMKYVKRVLL